MTSHLDRSAEGRALRQAAFIRALESVGNYAEAAREAQVVYETQREWRKDEAFAELCKAALAKFQGSLHKEIVRRGRDGVQEPVLDKNGKPIYLYHPETGQLMLDDDLNPMVVTTTRRSDQLLLAAAEAHVPSYAKKKAGMAVGLAMDPEAEGGGLPTKITIEFVDAEDGRPKGAEADDPIDS